LSGVAVFVSIHAPAWGATAMKAQAWYNENVSIHAPAWGATMYAERRPLDESSFNPRARVGRDGPLKSISNPFCGFNPRARVGRDRNI